MRHMAIEMLVWIQISIAVVGSWDVASRDPEILRAWRSA